MKQNYSLNLPVHLKSYINKKYVYEYILMRVKTTLQRIYTEFILKLNNEEYLVLETKGVDSQQNQTKREYLKEWVKAVNNHGGFGKWHSDVSFHPSDIEDIVEKYTSIESRV